MAKRAFLVGINAYKNTSFTLRGCLNDITSLKDLLETNLGFQSSDIELALDADASRQNILNGLTKIVGAASAGDQIVFAFSGHGCRKTVLSSTGHPDGLADAIVSWESTYDGLITSEELHKIIFPKINKDVHFSAIYDCCHSGTLIRDIGFGTDGEMTVLFENRFVTVIPPVGDLTVREVLLGEYNVFSACGDTETAADCADVPVEHRPRGAFSYALHSIIRDAAGVITIRDVEKKILPVIQAISPHVQNPVFWSVDETKNAL